jgi:hypothetical protein
MYRQSSGRSEEKTRYIILPDIHSIHGSQSSGRNEEKIRYIILTHIHSVSQLRPYLVFSPSEVSLNVLHLCPFWLRGLRGTKRYDKNEEKTRYIIFPHIHSIHGSQSSG